MSNKIDFLRKHFGRAATVGVATGLGFYLASGSVGRGIAGGVGSAIGAYIWNALRPN